MTTKNTRESSVGDYGGQVVRMKMEKEGKPRITQMARIREDQTADHVRLNRKKDDLDV